MENEILPRWMRKTIGFLIIVLLVFLTAQLSHNLRKPMQTLSITGEGRVSAVPDEATVTLGVISQGANSVDVKNQNNQKLNQIIAFIKGIGVSEKDIQTSNFYASPLYNYANGQNTITGYQADQTVTVKVKGIDKSQDQLSKMLDGAVNQGANTIRGINFNFGDAEHLRQEARKLAVKNAREKAEALTDAADLNLGPVINVVSEGTHFRNPMPFAAMSLNAVNKSVAPTIEPGIAEVSESVTLLFELK